MRKACAQSTQLSLFLWPCADLITHVHTAVVQKRSLGLWACLAISVLTEHQRAPRCSLTSCACRCPQGRVYYLNHTTKTTTWDDPRLTWTPPPSQPTAASDRQQDGGGQLDPREAAIAESAASAVALRERAGILNGMDPKARQTEALYISEMANREQIKLDALTVSVFPTDCFRL